MRMRVVYERVYLPLGKVADTPFHIQGDDLVFVIFTRFKCVKSDEINVWKKTILVKSQIFVDSCTTRRQNLCENQLQVGENVNKISWWARC